MSTLRFLRPLRALFALVAVAAAPLLFACASKPSPQLTKVDITAENHPPIPPKVSGAGITVAEGIGIAVTVSGYVDDKPVQDHILANSSSTNFRLVPGSFSNEYFLIGGAPGTGKITFTDEQMGGTLDVTVTVVAQ